MPLTIVLAVGVDSYLFGPQRAIWQSAGLFVTSAGSMREAIDQFRFGDFDLVLLGHSITEEDKERLTSFVRASGSRTPMVFLSSVSDDCDAFASPHRCVVWNRGRDPRQARRGPLFCAPRAR